jgi:peptidoglycan-N-acetylglucosamine deacetylase
LTSDVGARLAWHNAGRSHHTSKHAPWRLLVSLEFPEQASAARFERYLKSGSGRAFARRHFAESRHVPPSTLSDNGAEPMTSLLRSSNVRLVVILATALCVLQQHPRAQQPTPNQPGTKWTDDQLRQSVELARVGRKLTPKRWPNDSRVAVCLSFDTDSEAPLLRDGNTSPTSLSASDFGAESGMPRILKMLDRYDIPATFFMTAVDAMLHPDMLAAILKPGRHEVGVHGWIHEFPPRLEDGEEERLLDRAIAYLTKATGKRPVGYRAPSWAFSPSTLDLIQKKGFLYDSSLQALDEPYEIVSRGKNTGIVELAIDWTLTETPYLGQNGRMPSPELLYQLYKDEFDGAYDEGTLFVLTLHPYLSGHRAPMRHLDRFVAYMKSKPGVWFATGEQVAKYLKTGQ